MMTLYYDTETTGLPDYKSPSEAPNQPHIVQLGAILVDQDWNTVGTLDAIIRPDGWEIPEEVARIHGITTERALAEGRPAIEVIDAFWELVLQAERRVGFNESFDARILRIALKRHKSERHAEHWKAQPTICAMRMATPMCKLPPTPAMQAKNMRFHKNPNLTEACHIIMGETLEGAHSAMVDAAATMRLFRHMTTNQPVRTMPPITSTFHGQA